MDGWGPSFRESKSIIGTMSQFVHQRHFTVEEANSLLPAISNLLIKLNDALVLFRRQQQTAVETLKQSRGNGKHGQQEEQDALSLVRDIIAEIEGYGCVIKSFEEPLIDFPSIRDGEEVFLCWRLGEPEVGAWHPLDEGFASRQPI